MAAEASAAAVAAVSVHGTGTALGAPANMLCGLIMPMRHCHQSYAMLCGQECHVQ